MTDFAHGAAAVAVASLPILGFTSGMNSFFETVVLQIGILIGVAVLILAEVDQADV
jgi:hypothetical protein